MALIFWLGSAAAYADCPLPGHDDRATGAIVHNTDYDVLQICRTDGEWYALGTFDPTPLVPPGPAGCDNIGDVCSDGSVYAGFSPDPDGTEKMYTTPADASGDYTWNNGTENWIDTEMVNCTSATPGGQAECRMGWDNCMLLAGLSDAASPYAAAAYCDSLEAHGHDDWYLPAQDELDVLYDNRAAIGAFNITGSYPAGYYWSSSEANIHNGRAQQFSGGGQSYNAKSHGLSVRCVRR